MINVDGRTLGYRPDPPKREGEKPDWVFTSEALSAAPLPERASVADTVVDILDQGQVGSCVLNSIMQAIRCSHVRQGIKEPKLGSRLFAYYLARALDGTTKVDGGTYLRSACEILNKFGFPPEELWPYEAWRFDKMPDTEAFRTAFDQKAPTVYRRILQVGYDRVNSVKQALHSGFPVCFGTQVSRAFVNGHFHEDSPLDPPNGVSMAGGHAMLVDSYDGDTFGIVNSWGTLWGNGGRCLFSADYLAWSETNDLWVIEHAPNYSE